MSEKRMFNAKIIESDDFMDLPATSQCLYFHLNMYADDDGVVNCVRKVMKITGLSKDDLGILLAKRFLLPLSGNLIVIKHWKMHNSIRKDRYIETQYKEELATLTIKSNGAYTEKYKTIISEEIPETQYLQGLQPIDNQVSTKCQPTDNQLTTKCQPNGYGKNDNGVHSIVEDSIVEDSIVEYRRGEEEIPPEPPTEPTTSNFYGIHKNVKLSSLEFENLKNKYPTLYQQKIDRLSNYMNDRGRTYSKHYSVICRWIEEDLKKTYEKPKYKNQFNDFEQREYDPKEFEKEMLRKAGMIT